MAEVNSGLSSGLTPKGKNSSSTTSNGLKLKGSSKDSSLQSGLVPKAPSKETAVKLVTGIPASKAEIPQNISFGQAALNTLLTPYYFSTGVVDAVLKNVTKAVKGKTDFVSPTDQGAKNVGRAWSNEKVITGKDIVENRILTPLGLDNPILFPTQPRRPTPTQPGASASSAAVNVAQGPLEGARVSDVAGFALDVAVDPLSYVPLGIVTTPAKITAKAGARSVAALKAGLAGETSLNVAAKNLNMTPQALEAKVVEQGGKVNVRKAGLRIPENLKVEATPQKPVFRRYGSDVLTSPAELISKAEKEIAENYVYKTVITEDVGARNSVVDSLLSALEAGKKEFGAGIITAAVREYGERVVRKDVKGVFKKQNVVKLSKDADAGDWVLRTGNGAVIDRYPSLEAAKDAQKLLRDAPTSDITPTAAVTGAKISDDEATLDVPTEDGDVATLELNRPYIGDNGKATIWDGKNVLEFESVDDANSFLDIKASPAVENLEATVAKSGKQWIVNAGGKTTTFTTKKAADAYAEAARTGQVAPAPKAPVVGKNLLIDTPAPVPTVKEMLATPTKGEASALKSVLSNLDELAKSVKGLTSGISHDLREKIVRVLNPSQARFDQLLGMLKEEAVTVLRRVAENEITPFQALSIMERSGLKQQQQLAAIIKTARIPGSKATIAEGMTATRGNFLELSNKLGAVDGNLEARLVEYFREELYNRTMLIQKGKIRPGVDEDALYEQLKVAVGEEIADKVKATGYLVDRNPKTEGKLRQVLNNLSLKSSEVGYTGYDDMVAGLQRGDEISLNALEQIFKLIDPERKLIQSVEQIPGEPGQAYLRRVLTDNGGVQTIQDAERKLAMAGDPSFLLKAQGLGYADIVASIISELTDKGIDAAKAALAKESVIDAGISSTRQAAAERIAQNWVPWRDQVANAINRAFFGDAAKTGRGGILERYENIRVSEGFTEQVSSLGDLAVRNTVKPYEGNALLPQQANQYLSVKIKGSLLGTTAKRAETKAEVLGADYIGKTDGEKINLLIEQMDQANDMLHAVAGSPMVIVKPRNDSTIVEAFADVAAKAKKTKKLVNWSANDLKHSVYLHTGDVLRAVQAAGGENALARAFFPAGKVNYKKDVMSWIGFDDAARRVLEMHAAGEPLNVEEIAARLLSRGDEQLQPSAAKQAEFEQLAKELADFLTDERAVNILKSTHLERAASLVVDYADAVNAISRDLFETMRQGWRMNFLEGELSEVARAEQVKQWFRKFVYASGIMKLRGGDIAETMFRAAAMMYTRNGKILPESKLSKLVANDRNVEQMLDLLDNTELALFREEMTRISRILAPDTAAPIGREAMKRPTAAAKEKAENALVEAEEVYQRSIENYAKLGADATPADVTAWERAHRKAQTQLNKAREVAWNNWLPTRHFDMAKQAWVPSEKYNYDAVLREMEQGYTRYVAGVRGAEDRAIYLADSRPVVPPHRKLTRAQKAKWLEQFRKESAVKQVENVKAIIDDTAANIEKEFDAGRFDNPDMTPAEQSYRAMQEMYARSTAEATQLPQVRMVATQHSNFFSPVTSNRIDFNRQYRPNFDENTPIALGDKMAVRLKRLGEQLYGPAGRRDLKQFLNTAESTGLVMSSRFADAVASFRQRWHKNSTADDFAQVFGLIRDGRKPAANANARIVNMYQELKGITDILVGSINTNAFKMNGIDGQAFAEALKKFGINEKQGFSDFTEYSVDDLAQSLLDDLPFGPVPEKLKGTDAAIAWQKRKALHDKTGQDPLLAMARVMEAVQMVKTEKGLAESVAARFGTTDAAKAAREGFVKIAVKGKDDIARFIPGGTYFHPEIADQFGSVIREWNTLYNSKRLGIFANAIMEVTGFLKLTQTILRPGHHVTNIVGDTTTALIVGVRNPDHWAGGFRISARYMGDQIDANYFLQNNHAAKMRELLRMMDSSDKSYISMLEGQPATGVKVYKNGKPQLVQLSDEELVDRLERAGILTQNTMANDIQGLDDSYRILAASDREASTWDKLAARARQAEKAIAKVPGDFTAAYSNAIRVAHALKVIQSRSWNSIDDAIRGATDVVNKFHPTVQSLAASERKYGRLLFTYYTWIRVANAAFIDMAVNHTGAMLVIPKAQYAYAQAQGYDPQSPAIQFSDKNLVPSYISYSTYGPNAWGDQGAQIVKPAFLANDVLDFWGIQVDPTKSLSENLFAREGGGFVFSEIASNLNLLAKTAIAVTPGVNYDVDTGKPANIDTVEKLGDELLSNFGFTNFLIGIGAYTPQKYLNPESPNQLTEADRKRMLNAFFSGLRPVDVERQVYKETAKRENTEKQTRIRDAKIKEFVAKKRAEGLTDEEIITLLRQMGVR